MTMVRITTAACLVALLLIAVTATGQAPPPPSYVLGPGDILEISVWPQSDFSRSVAVGPDGRIAVSPVGEFYVAGMTPTSLATRVSAQLNRYIKDAHVTVIVTGLKGKNVSVLGQVRNPGLYNLNEGARLIDAIATAGGSTFAARLQNVYISTGMAGGTRVITVNVERILRGEDEAANLILRPNDVVFVPGTLSAAVDELRKIAPNIQIQVQVQGQGP